MLLEEITQEIELDSIIDNANLDRESLKISQLHSKYYSMMIQELKTYKRLEADINIMMKEKTEYYLGKSSDAIYRENPLFHKVLKTDLDLYLKADKDLNNLNLKVVEQKAKVDFIESFIKVINNRSFVINNAINFIKFKNGIN